jgi:hypothetical protein
MAYARGSSLNELPKRGEPVPIGMGNPVAIDGVQDCVTFMSFVIYYY